MKKFDYYLEMVGGKKLVAKRKEEIEDTELLTAFGKNWKWSMSTKLSSLVGKKVTEVDENEEMICFGDKLVKGIQYEGGLEIYDIAKEEDEEKDDKLREGIAKSQVRRQINSARFEREKERQSYSDKSQQEKRNITKELKTQPRFKDAL